MSSPYGGESAEIDAMVAKLGAFVAEIGAISGDDVAVELLRAELAMRLASQRLTLLVAEAAGRPRRASLLRAAREALADVTDAVDQLRRAVQARGPQ
jgi:glycine cleavage system regulatory protein